MIYIYIYMYVCMYMLHMVDHVSHNIPMVFPLSHGSARCPPARRRKTASFSTTSRAARTVKLGNLGQPDSGIIVEYHPCNDTYVYIYIYIYMYVYVCICIKGNFRILK